MGIETLEANIDLKMDEKGVSFTDIWKSGSLIEINIKNEPDWLYSKIEIRDSNYNLRLMSKKSGEFHFLKSRLPSTFKQGKWKFILKIRKKDRIDIFQRDFILAPKNYLGKLDPSLKIQGAKPPNVDNLEYTMIDGENPESAIKESEEEKSAETSITENNISDSEEIISPIIENTFYTNNVELEKSFNDEVKNDIDQNSQSSISPDVIISNNEIEITNKTEQDHPKEIQEDNMIDLSNKTNESLSDLLSGIKSYNDLIYIKTEKLTNDEIDDLSIPLAEIIEVSQPYYKKLKENKINYIYQLLMERPEKIFKISEIDLEILKSWLVSIYKVYNNVNHPLRKEYRKIANEFIKYKQIVNSLKDTDKIEKSLDTLISIKPENIVKLNENNIYTISDLFQISFLDLVKLDLDEKNPLVPKLWIANAKSFVGLN